MRHIWFMVHLNGNYLKIMFSLSRNYEDVMSSLVRFWLGAFLGKRTPQNNPTDILSPSSRNLTVRKYGILTAA